MSVIIKDMPMPKDCGSCFLNEYMTCTILDKDASISWKLDDCPLIEQKTGKWNSKLLDKFRKYEVVCSECGARYIGNYDAYDEPYDFNYCPNCGARMVEDG